MKQRKFIALLLSVVMAAAGIYTVFADDIPPDTAAAADSTASGSGLEYDDALDIYSIYPYPLNLTFGAVKVRETEFKLPTRDIEKKIFDALSYCPYDSRYSHITDPLDIDPDIALKLYDRWYHTGLPYGINPSKYFDAKKYLEYNPDVYAVCGNDLTKAYEHYITYGYKEGRNSGGVQLEEYVYHYGDMDVDGLVTSCDAAVLYQKVLTPEYITPMEKKVIMSNYIDAYSYNINYYLYEYADVDMDENFTSSDVAQIMQKTLNSSYKMPCELKTSY